MPSDFDNFADFVPQGWICPACKTIHAPFVTSCNCQKPKVNFFSGGTPKGRILISNPYFTFSFEDPFPELT